ncbi:MAG TPA: sulfur carrier protein ThiS [Bacillota bacterium]|nr:sulfur carrier protein ThiS [Bacillota bacterium]
MNIKVNGKTEALVQECSVKDFLAAKGLEATSVVIDLNGHIVKAQDWEETLLREGDVLEILRLVGGG